MNPQILCVTSILFLVGLYFFIIKPPHQKTKPEYFLATLLVICSIVSILFWSNPIKKSKMHKIDKLVARITITIFILYTLFYKQLNTNSLTYIYFYLFLILGGAIAFYTSHYYSSKNWTSNEHILSHGIAHILGIIGICYAF